ncbi:MAG: DUF3467 domain-containing protein [Terracidiphilus sp.]
MNEQTIDEIGVEQPALPISKSLTEDFVTSYANNFHFELSSWDLKILFGQLSQMSGKPDVDWHTAMTMPWGAAKLLRYLLSLNIAIYESNSGPIKLPASAIPPIVAPPSGDEDTEQNRAFYGLAIKLHNELTGEGQKP